MLLLIADLGKLTN